MGLNIIYNLKNLEMTHATNAKVDMELSTHYSQKNYLKNLNKPN